MTCTSTEGTRLSRPLGENAGVSFDLAVLAMSASADQEAAIAMAGRCWNPRRHADGEVDARIDAFYTELRSRFPDDATAGDDSPWMVMPLDVGIDHVIMHLSFSPRSAPAIEAIEELAGRHKLVLYDAQSDDVYLPLIVARGRRRFRIDGK